MRLVVQRVEHASVSVNNDVVGHIKHGLLCYVGFTHQDTPLVIDKAVKKLLKLRIFDDENKMMNLNVSQVQGSLLVVSQFTLYGETKSSNRPSWMLAAKPDQAKPLYTMLVDALQQHIHTESGQFGEHMKVQYTNDGPVTMIIELEG